MISKIAGIDLIPAMDYEIGHVNLSVKSEEQTMEELAQVDEQRKFFAEDEGIAGCPWYVSYGKIVSSNCAPEYIADVPQGR